jgi:cell wall-active antibiotic response 4TMS protein YvqF
MNPEAPPSMPPETPIVGYCRACGKALDAATVHTAHGTIYCAEHVPAEPPPMSGATDSPYASPYTANPYASTVPPPVPHPDVSPGVAFVLGLIPGVGAIYNGQYAKGLIHVFILGMLFTIVGSNGMGGFEPLFGVLIPGFWAYMAFEAYHTAKLRQMGQPVDEFSSLVPGHGGSRFPVAPILLIALGVVFLLNNLEIFELRRMLRYWPVMLIALGLYLLYLRMAGTSSGVDSRRNDAPVNDVGVNAGVNNDRR